MLKKITLILLFLLFMFLPARTLARFAVIINFDDAYQGVYDNAYPLLLQEGLPAVVFVPTNYVGQSRHLNLEQLKELKSAGWEIGSHTVNHPHLLALTPQGLQYEILTSKEFLQENNLLTPDYASFCSPNTAWSPDIEKVVAEHYQLARGKKVHFFTAKEEVEFRQRVMLKNTSLVSIKKWILEAQAKDLPIVLIFHEVAEGGNEYYFPPQVFQQLVSFIKDMPVITFQEFYNSLQKQ